MIGEDPFIDPESTFTRLFGPYLPGLAKPGLIEEPPGRCACESVAVTSTRLGDASPCCYVNRRPWFIAAR